MSTILGIPILFKDKCAGVAWIEYENSSEPPNIDEMKRIYGFAGHAGLLIEFYQVDFVDRTAVESIGREINENLLVTGEADLEGFPIEAYIKSESHQNSPIGGDFFAVRKIDEETFCVLLGDGKGHAVSGALNMLPMFAIYESFWRDSRSASHVLDKMNKISTNLGTQGTAIYCIFTKTKKALFISVSSAGHEPLIIKHGSDLVRSIPNESEDVGGIIGFPVIHPLKETHKTLVAGDILTQVASYWMNALSI